VFVVVVDIKRRTSALVNGRNNGSQTCVPSDNTGHGLLTS